MPAAVTPKKTETNTAAKPVPAPKGAAAKKAAETPTSVAQTPDVAAPVTAAASVPAAPKKTNAKAAGGNAVTQPVIAQDAGVAPVATTDQAAGATSVGDNLISDILEKFTSLSAQIKTMQSSLKLLAKEFDKQKKIIDKVQKKKEKAKKSPSGFAKPCKISDELCEFIGIPKGTEQSRTDITRFINSYVKQHNLNNPQNRREFFPDKKLKAILNVKDGDKVTYFVLQRLIAHHFPPSMSKLAAANKAQ